MYAETEANFLRTINQSKKYLQLAEEICARGLQPFNLTISEVSKGKLALVAFQNLISSDRFTIQVNLNCPGPSDPITCQPTIATAMAAVFEREFPLPDDEALLREFCEFMQKQMSNPSSILCTAVAAYFVDRDRHSRPKIQIPGR